MLWSIDRVGRSPIELVALLETCRGHDGFGCFWLERLRRGPRTHWKAPPFTARTRSGHQHQRAVFCSGADVPGRRPEEEAEDRRPNCCIAAMQWIWPADSARKSVYSTSDLYCFFMRSGRCCSLWHCTFGELAC